MPEKEIGSFFVEVGLLIVGGVVWAMRKVFGMNSRLTAVETRQAADGAEWQRHLREDRERQARVDQTLITLNTDVATINTHVATIKSDIKSQAKTSDRILDIVSAKLMDNHD